MPGKKDPEYFPINYNMSGLGGFFGVGRAGSPSLLTPAHHHGKFEYDSTDTSGGLNMSMSFNVSIPPVNSEEDEETTTDDEETSSMTGSDIDVDMDTLVLSIRKKLKMSPKFNHHHHRRHHSRHPSISDDFWTADSDHDDDDEENISSGNNSDNVGISGVNNCNNSNNTMNSSNNISNNSNGNSNSSSSSSSSSNNNSNVVGNASTRRCRINPYSHSQWRPSNVQSISHQHRHIINGRIQKHHHHPQHWWARQSAGKKCSDNNSASVSLLQELITSGSLIKEAVRRININRFTSISANSKKFTYNDQECENNITSCYPPQITPIV